MLPNRKEFGESEKLQKGGMYHQDFYRLKATLLNNMSSCFFSLKEITEAEKFNDLALMEDPAYGKAHYRKCLILEARGQYSGAINIAQGCIEEYSHEFETDKGSVSMVPKFKELIERL